MKNLLRIDSLLFVVSLSLILNSCSGTRSEKEKNDVSGSGNFRIGWASADLTPDGPVLIRGQWVSEGVRDPIKATVLAMESGKGPSAEKVILISCDLIYIPDGTRDGLSDNLRDNVRKLIKEYIPEINIEQVILNGTHTHVCPSISSKSVKELAGVDLDVMEPRKYQDLISDRIARAAVKAWKNRKPGGITYGLGYAAAGNNRVQVEFSGAAQMHGNINRPEFSHLEGFVDHSVNLLYTWDKNSKLTGVVINLTCTSQVMYGYLISADFWHDTRVELAKRLGKDVYILPQSSPGGDQSPHDIIIDRKAETRMQRLMFPGVESGKNSPGRRKQIASRISDAVTSVLPFVSDSIEWDPVFAHRMKVVGLSRRIVTPGDVNDALKSYPGIKEGMTLEYFEKRYEQLLLELKNNPAMKEKPRWYGEIARSYAMIKRAQNLKEQYEVQAIKPKVDIEVHVIRIGDIVIATNPFELYLDFGTRMKARSPAVQTFLVQLAGSGTYLPPARSVAGAAYGSIPASNLVGPEGGQELVENTLELINTVWGK